MVGSSAHTNGRSAPSPHLYWVESPSPIVVLEKFWLAHPRICRGPLALLLSCSAAVASPNWSTSSLLVTFHQLPINITRSCSSARQSTSKLIAQATMIHSLRMQEDIRRNAIQTNRVQRYIFKLSVFQKS